MFHRKQNKNSLSLNSLVKTFPGSDQIPGDAAVVVARLTSLCSGVVSCQAFGQLPNGRGFLIS